MSEDNKATLRRFMDEVFQKGNVSAVDELVADEFVDHSPMPGTAAGKAGIKDVSHAYRGAFPDLQITIDDIIAEGDMVAMRISGTGTHQGALMGIAPTGRKVNMTEQHFVRFAHGRIVEHWGVEDTLGMMQQLGVVNL